MISPIQNGLFFVPSFKMDLLVVKEAAHNHGPVHEVVTICFQRRYYHFFFNSNHQINIIYKKFYDNLK